MSFPIHLSRRHLMASAAGAIAASALPQRAFAQDAAPIIKRPIPQTPSVSLPIVGIGTAIIFDFENDPVKTEDRKGVLRNLVAGGGNLIDTAPAYGNAENQVGMLAADTGLRDKLFLATKYSSGLDRAAAEASLQESLRRLKTSRIDLMQAWNVNDPDFSLAQLKEWKAKGTIRHIGITSSMDGAYENLAAVIKREKPEFFQINYSLGDRDAEKMLLPLARDNGCAVLTNLPFGRASMFQKVGGKPVPDWAKEIDCTSWAQIFLKYNLSHPAVTAVIPGTDKPQYMLDNLNAGRGRMPDAAFRKRIEDHWATI